MDSPETQPKFSSKELLAKFADSVLQTYGGDAEFDHTASPSSATANSLIFLQTLEQAPAQAAVIVTTQSIAEQLLEQNPGLLGKSLLVCVENVRLAQAKIKQHFDDYQSSDAEWVEIHDSAVIHKSAKLGNHCRVGPNAVIGAHCRIGDHSIVRANAVIEHGVTIGERSIINSGANIGYNSILGDRVTVQAGSIIGSEGYGFAPDAEKRYHRIPHTGNVVLNDDVHIGANTCIDRGTYGSTVIARGVKIDNLVHIAHNVSIGEDTLLTAQTVIAGSSTIGKRVIASGQTGILDHKSVADDAILVHRAGVIEDIPHGGMWAGLPAKPLKEWVRTINTSKKIAKLEQAIKELKQQLADQ